MNEWSARRRDLYLTTHNTHKRQTYKPPAGFELQNRQQEAADPRFRPQCHWFRPACNNKLKTKLRGLSPHANYTDRAAAAGRRS